MDRNNRLSFLKTFVENGAEVRLKPQVQHKYTSYTDYYLQSIRGWNKTLLLGILLLYFVPIFMDYAWTGGINTSENFEGLLTVMLVFGSWVLSITFLLVALLLPCPQRLRSLPQVCRPT